MVAERELLVIKQGGVEGRKAGEEGAAILLAEKTVSLAYEHSVECSGDPGADRKRSM